MAELYTSLTQLKMALNDGQMPPMTRLPENLKRVIDPAFTIGGDGWGGLVDDEALGLRCPLRGCGVYRHQLSRHLNADHRDIGGASGLRALMSLGASTPLISSAERVRRAALYEAKGPLIRANADRARRSIRRRPGLPRGTRLTSVNRANMADSCVAQLSHRIIDLHNRLGREPTFAEFCDEYSSAKGRAVKDVFGSWNNALAHCGMERHKHSRPRRWRLESVTAALAAWHTVHGCLPSSADSTARSKTPILPSYRATLEAFGVDSWRDAMETAASLLDIHGGRYGLPERTAGVV